MASWFGRIIDKERRIVSWNSVSELYTLLIESNTFDDSIIIQPPQDSDCNSAFLVKSNEYEKLQNNQNEENKRKISIADYVYLIQNHI
jgi:hypothetical protein